MHRTDCLSTILFAEPSFLEGMGRILDFGDTLTGFNASFTPERADTLAMSADWQAVGEDMRRAMEQFARELDQQRSHGAQR